MSKIRLKVKEHIERSGLTQAQFAEKVGLRPATISLMVNNKYDRLHLDHLVKLMNYLKTSDFNDILEIAEIAEDVEA